MSGVAELGGDVVGLFYRTRDWFDWTLVRLLRSKTKHWPVDRSTGCYYKPSF